MKAAILALVLLAGPAAAHEWYVGLINSEGQSCCGGADCRPVEVGQSRIAGDRIEIFDIASKQWLPVPDKAILTRQMAADGSIHYDIRSPDGRMHACSWGGEIKCLLLPASL